MLERSQIDRFWRDGKSLDLGQLIGAMRRKKSKIAALTTVDFS